MEVNKKALIGIMLAVSFIISSNNVTYGYENNSSVDEILKTIELSIKEYKVTGSFNTVKTKDETYNQIIKVVKNLIGQVEISPEDKNKFKINYGEEECNGEIMIHPYKEGYEVVFSISLYGENLSFDEKDKLETKMKNVLSILNSKVEYSLCVKSEIMNNTMDEVREMVINNLSSREAKNTEEVKIYNGYSIIGYTGLDNKRTILEKDIDFNCAIVKYSSGCYLIMGEPEITITY